MAKKMHKQMPKRDAPKPIENAPPAAPPSPAPPEEDAESARERIRTVIRRMDERLEGKQEGPPADDIGLDRPLEGEAAAGGEFIGPWRAKLVAPLVRRYAIGVNTMRRNRALSKPSEIAGYVEGLDACFEVTLSMMDILLRKYLERVPYVEEIFAGVAGLTCVAGSRYMDARLSLGDADRGAGAGKDANPAPPPGDGNP